MPKFCPICKKKMFKEEQVSKSGEILEFWKCEKCRREYDTKGPRLWSVKVIK